MEEYVVMTGRNTFERRSKSPYPKFDEATLMEQMMKQRKLLDKPVFPVVSTHPIETKASLEPAHVAQLIGQRDDEFRSMYSLLKDVDGPILPCHLDAILSDRKTFSVKEMFEEVLYHPFEPTESQAYVSKAFVAPTRSVFEAAITRTPHGGSMLVVEPRAADVARLNEVMRDRRPRDTTVVVVSKARIDIIGTPIAKGLVFTNSASFSTYALRAENKANFDVIVFPYSLAKEIGTSAYPTEFVASVKSLLKPGGSIYGLYVDVDEVRRQSMEPMKASANLVTIYAENPAGARSAVPTVITKMGGSAGGKPRYFEDYAIDGALIQSLATQADAVTVFTGREFLRSWPAKRKVNDFNNQLAMVRIVVWRVGVMRPYWLTDKEPDLGMERTNTKVVDYDTSHWFTDTNHGLPFSDADLFFHIPSKVIITPKADGTEAVAVSNAEGDVLVAVRGDPFLWRARWKLPRDVAIQLEIIGELECPKWLVLTDVTHWGDMGDAGYQARMDMARLELSERCSPITVPTYLVGNMHPKLNTLVPEYPYDGYVINNIGAPPGRVARGYGAARYLKEIYTYERKMDNGLIAELRLSDDAFIKWRTDRSEGSKPDEIRLLRRAWTAQEYQTRIRFLNSEPPGLSRLIRVGPNKHPPYYRFTQAELVYLWVPWRIRTIETDIAANFGLEAVEQFQCALATALRDQIALEVDMEKEPVEETAPEPTEQALPDLSMVPDWLSPSSDIRFIGLN